MEALALITPADDQTSLAQTKQAQDTSRHVVAEEGATLDDASLEKTFTLVELPTEFDPDAEHPSPSINHKGAQNAQEGDEEDVLRVPIVTAEDEEEAAEAAAAAAAAEREKEDGDMTRDPDWMKLLQGLADTDGDGDVQGDGMDGIEEGEGEGSGTVEGEIVVEQYVKEVEKEADMPSISSSPLSDLPDLPSQLYLRSEPEPEEEIIAERRPATKTKPRLHANVDAKAKTKRAHSPRLDDSEAESSTTAAKRAKMSRPELTNTPRKTSKKKKDAFEEAQANIVIGKRARKQIQHLEFGEPEGMDEEGYRLASSSKAGGGGLNGKSKGQSKRKLDSAFSGSAGTVTKASSRPKVYTDAQLRQMLKGKTRERQIGPCLRPRYTGWGKCCQCVGKIAGDSCRFKEFRMFDIDPETADIIDMGDFLNTVMKEDLTPLPREFNVRLEEEHLRRTDRTVATFLLPIITRELRHLINNKAVIREADVAKHRSVCDFCSSTIFGGYFFCQKCGKDYCLQCERYFSDSLETMGESPWFLENAARPRLLRCTNAVPIKGRLATKGEDEVREIKPVVESRLRSRSPNGEAGSEVPDRVASPTRPDNSKEDEITVQGPEIVVDSEVGAEKETITEDPNIDGPADGVDVAETGTTPTLNGVDNGPELELAESLPKQMPEVAPDTDFSRNDDKPDASFASLSEVTEPSSSSSSSNIAGRRAKSAVIAKPNPPDPSTLGPRSGSASYVRKTRTNFHVRPELLPVTRFHREDLEDHWKKLLGLVLDEDMSRDDRARWLGLEECDGELLDQVEEYVRNRRLPAADRIATTDPKGASTDSNTDTKDDPDLPVNKYYTKSTTSRDPSVKPIPDPAGLEDKSHPFMLVQAEELDNTLFDRLWSKGEPMVVDGVGERFKQSWTPDTFINRFGSEDCLVVDCESEKTKSTTVGQFFQDFKDPVRRAYESQVWKLKDWPSTHEFQSAYPDLYNDFCDSLPVPDFTRREGVLNLYAHFPDGPTKPDIGPKMYNAFEAIQTSGGQGSTRLHMDVADAINIMLYASPRTRKVNKTTNANPDPTPAPNPNPNSDEIVIDNDDENKLHDGDASVNGAGAGAGVEIGNGKDNDNDNDNDENKDKDKDKDQTKEREHETEDEAEVNDSQPGCAVWDLFRAEDADKIRLFLREKFGGQVHFTDPIHSQIFYLDADLRKELADQYGVVSYRVYQYVGQAVFIPAGCAHQVCNLADCIKIALDFVSPHNVSRCQQLMHDFRKENYIKAWKEDVLQLYNVMWYSWLNAQETRQRRAEEEAAARDRKNQPNGHSNTDTLGRQGLILGHPPLSARLLTTQVSSVRDEPTPTPTTTSRAQSPISGQGSKEGTPDPAPNHPEGLDPGDFKREKEKEEEIEKEKELVRERDRKTLFDKLFETMLTKSDDQPSSTPADPPSVNQEQVGDQKATPKREEKDRKVEVNYKTSDFVKQGLIPMSLAWRAFEQGSKNERVDVGEGRVGGQIEGEGEGGGAGEGEVEFSLENL